MFLRIRRRCTPVFSRIYQHPFNQQLYAGTLSSHTFRLFLQQDEMYLREFSNALLLLSQRFDCNDHSQQFTLLAKYIKDAELSLHRNYLNNSCSQLFFAQKQIRQQKIPVIKHYTEHLLHTVKNASIEEAIACVLPCFWIYCELGKQMDISKCTINHPYRKWIATYSDEEFVSTTNALIQTFDELTMPVNCQELQEKIICSFLKSARFELNFFDAAISWGRNAEHNDARQSVCRS